MNRLQNKDGTPSRYGFACGYIAATDIDRDNRISLEWSHGVSWFVKGTWKGERVWFTTPSLKNAWRCYRAIVRSMRCAAIVDGMVLRGEIER